MRNSIFILSLLTAIITTAVIACDGPGFAKDGAKNNLPDSAAKVKRGEYLVTVGGCDDCHSPKIMGPKGPEIDMERRLSGYPSQRPMPQFNASLAQKGISQFNEDLTATAGPWGVTFAANLTSDVSGAGSWPLQNFIYAMRHGKLKGLEGSRPILPPMPWFNLAKMTDEDLEAMHAFLQSTKPVENVVPAPKQFADLK
jgi:cytochrome c553